MSYLHIFNFMPIVHKRDLHFVNDMAIEAITGLLLTFAAGSTIKQHLNLSLVNMQSHSQL